jgi:hypothetical protein
MDVGAYFSEPGGLAYTVRSRRILTRAHFRNKRSQQGGKIYKTYTVTKKNVHRQRMEDLEISAM